MSYIDIGLLLNGISEDDNFYQGRWVRKLVIRPMHPGGAGVQGAFRNISGTCQLSAQLWKSALDLVVFWFYSGLLGGRVDVTGEPGGGAAYICAGRCDCKPGLLEVGISFVRLWLFVKVQGT